MEFQLESAAGLALALVRIVGAGGSILKVAARVAISRPAYGLQQVIVTRTVIHAECLGKALLRAPFAAWSAAIRIVNDSPGTETVGPLIGIQDSIPIQRYRQPLRKHVGVKAWLPAVA